MKDKFEEWLKPDLKDTSVRNYSGAISGTLSAMAQDNGLASVNLYELTDVIEFEKIKIGLESLDDFKRRNRKSKEGEKGGNGMYSRALHKYLEFLKRREPQYWEYYPGSDARYWDKIYSENVIAIGWDKLGDIRNKKLYSDKDSVSAAILKEYPDEHKYPSYKNKERKRTKSSCWDIANEMRIGDVIIVKQGRRTILGWGIVKSDYEYDKNRPPYKVEKSEPELYPNIREVSWIEKGSWQLNHKPDFTIQTLYKITNNDKKNEIEGILNINKKYDSYEGNYYPDDITDQEEHNDNAVKTVMVNKYERDQKNRTACIEHYTTNPKRPIKCSICEFDFESIYGEHGFGFIHIHHTTLLSKMKNEKNINPKEDLIPVCCNCHAMLHRKRDILLKPEQLKAIINTQKIKD